MIEIQATTATQTAHRDFIELLDRLHRPTVTVRRDVGRVVRIGFGENFLRQRAGDGPAWAALAPATIRDRLRKGFGSGPILYRTGRLFRSYTEEFNQDHDQRQRLRTSGYELEYGSSDYRAAWHEGGTRHMPARPVTFLSNRAERDIEGTLGNYFNRVFQSAGF